LVIQLKNAAAADIAVVLDQLYAGSGKTVRVVAEPTSNRLLVYTKGEVMVEVRKLIEQLDAGTTDPTPPGGPGTRPAPRGRGTTPPGGPRPGGATGAPATGSSTSSSIGTSAGGSTTGTTGTSGSSSTTGGTTGNDKLEPLVVEL